MSRRVAIDLRMLVAPPDGVSRYSLELLRRVPPLLPGNQVFAVGRRELIREQVPKAAVLRAKSHPASAMEQLELAWLLKSRRVDLFHATSFGAPLLGRERFLLTLHDMIYLDLPGIYGSYLDWFFRTVTRRSAERAAAVLTVSEFSRGRIHAHFGIPTERIAVIPCGVDSRFRPAPPEEVEAVRARFGLPKEYLLYVGGFVAHKNVPQLLRAYARVKDAPPLILCGPSSENVQPELARLGLARRARTIPGQGYEVLPALYTGCLAFIFPSRYEGFGLPPVEAMACGAPTIVSDAGSLPEVTGGCALVYPEGDEEALAGCITRLLGSERERQTLSLSGRARALQFNWENTARRVAGLYWQLC